GGGAAAGVRDDGRPWRLAPADRRLPLERGGTRRRGGARARSTARLAARRDARGDAAARLRPPARPPRRAVGISRRTRRRGDRRHARGGGSRGCAHPAAAARGDTARGVTEPRVLIVEDDPELPDGLWRGLREEGFRAEAASSGAALFERIEGAAPDALVIDIGLPDADGRDLCQALRARAVRAPVLFLTARDALVDRLAAFDAGGDDYLIKPFAFAELLARLQALLRRAGAAGALAAAPPPPAPP